jgi:hypothetical protein
MGEIKNPKIPISPPIEKYDFAISPRFSHISALFSHISAFMIFLPVFPYLRVIFPYLRVFEILHIFPYLRVFIKILESLSQSWIGGCSPDWLQKLIIRTFFWLFRALLIGIKN